MRPFREKKKLLKITGFWVGRIFKGLPKVSEPLIYRQRHLESVRGESVYKHRNFLNLWALATRSPFLGGGLCCPPPHPLSNQPNLNFLT